MRTSFLVLLVACAPRYAPPDWLQGEWTSRRTDEDTSWFEWAFGADTVHRRTFEGLAQTDDVDMASIGYREEQEDGAYVLVNPLGDGDTRDTFLRTDDPDEVVWRGESPFFVVDSESVISRITESTP